MLTRLSPEKEKELTTPLPPNNAPAPSPTTERKPEPVIKKPSFVPAKPPQAAVTAPAMIKPLTPENLRQLPTVKACETNVMTFQQQFEHAKVSLIRTQLTQAKQLIQAQGPPVVTSSKRRDEEVRNTRSSPFTDHKRSAQFLQAQPQSSRGGPKKQLHPAGGRILPEAKIGGFSLKPWMWVPKKTAASTSTPAKDGAKSPDKILETTSIGRVEKG